MSLKLTGLKTEYEIEQENLEEKNKTTRKRKHKDLYPSDQFDIKESFGKSIEANKNKKNEENSKEIQKVHTKKLLMDTTNEQVTKKGRKIRLPQDQKGIASFFKKPSQKK